MIEVNPILREELEERGLYSDGLMRRIAKEGTVAHIEELPEDLRRVFVSAHDISPEYHIRMQAAFQRVHGQRGLQDRELPPTTPPGRRSRRCISWPSTWAARA